MQLHLCSSSFRAPLIITVANNVYYGRINMDNCCGDGDGRGGADFTLFFPLGLLSLPFLFFLPAVFSRLVYIAALALAETSWFRQACSLITRYACLVCFSSALSALCACGCRCLQWHGHLPLVQCCSSSHSGRSLSSPFEGTVRVGEKCMR